MRMNTARCAAAENGFMHGFLFVKRPVFRAVLFIGSVPLIAELPLRIGCIIHTVVYSVENRSKPAVIALVHPDHIDQGNAHGPAVGIQPVPGLLIFRGFLPGQVRLQVISVDQRRGGIRHAVSGIGILLHNRIGKDQKAKRTDNHAKHCQQKHNRSDQPECHAGTRFSFLHSNPLIRYDLFLSGFIPCLFYYI